VNAWPEPDEKSNDAESRGREPDKVNQLIGPVLAEGIGAVAAIFLGLSSAIARQQPFGWSSGHPALS
jgi:hypothetical protein